LGHRVQYLVRGGRLVQELEESEGRQRAMLDIAQIRRHEAEHGRRR